jgi:hypothetical protein
LIGFETDLQNLTKGMGIISHLFREYGSFRGEIPSRINGVLIALEAGTSMAYSLDNLQERGTLFVGPQEDIYAGMIVGENTRPADMVVNPCKAKNLTNMRSQGDGKGITLTASQTQLGARLGISVRRRVSRGDAKNTPLPQKDSRPHQAQTLGIIPLPLQLSGVFFRQAICQTADFLFSFGGFDQHPVLTEIGSGNFP